MNANTTFQKKLICVSNLRSRIVQFGQESRPAGEYLQSEQLWMLEKVSAALKTTSTTIPRTPHISKNPQKKKKSFGPGGSTEPSPVRPRVLSRWGTP